jgi:PhnB protein
MMQMNPYLSFCGNCEEALTFYAACFGGELGQIFRYGGSPMSTDVGPDWSNKVMHATLTVGGQVMMAGDVAPDRYEAPKGFSMSLHMKDAAQADRVFEQLAAGGNVVMPLAETFWAARFGMVVDRFGISWMINCEAADEPAA